MMRQTPLRHDGSTPRHDAGHPVGRHRNERQAHASVDGEIVHTLFSLLDQRVAEDFPGKVLGLAIHLFQCLIDRHRANRHRRVADDPFTGLVDVLAGRQVHHRVATPADGPGHFLDFLGDAGAHRGVADIGIDLDQEIPANRHGLDFRVVDVRRDDGATACDFIAHELGRDSFRDRGAKRLTWVLAQHALGEFFTFRSAGAQ